MINAVSTSFRGGSGADAGSEGHGVRTGVAAKHNPGIVIAVQAMPDAIFFVDPHAADWRAGTAPDHLAAPEKSLLAVPDPELAGQGAGVFM